MPLWQRGLAWTVGLRLIKVIVSLPVLLTLQRRGAWRDRIPDVLQFTTSSSSSTSSVVQVGALPKFLDQWRSITSNRFMLNMVKGHHLQLRSCPSLFCNFKWFNIKAATAHHPLTEGATEPSSDGAGLYSNVFVDPKHTSGLWPILNLKQFNHYIKIQEP